MTDTAPCCGENKHNWSEADQDVCDACLIESLQELEKQREAYITLTDRAAALHRRMLDRRNAALQLVLMFHKGGQWTDEDKAEWKRITGFDEATTKVLCDYIRKLALIGSKYLEMLGT